MTPPRVVVVQERPGSPITLTAYQGRESLAVVELTPQRAVAVAAELLALARFEV